ncbi:neuroepithelial cell-transforming gene 1 protein [Octopus bimaculoides]|uniref:neuroepithelial cell-transforming gene 1 protein n=1 Tax=Octopus bimaculoides TaxID=37653 RepID=UPI00071C4615|nr:neuroepithelial cell-transforming gene 1 protein [Octopus bimaculoides]|eukprot:XP_014789513.1 PREDICTED: neuroepithelial cell-transforming gene 1 protein-like [Octopus bimaculoides]
MKTPKMTSKENHNFCEPALPSCRRRFSLTSAASIMDLTELTFKRKRKKDEDSISVHSLDTSSFKNKKHRSMLRVSSLANLLSPAKPAKKMGRALQKSLNFKVPSTASPSLKMGSAAYKLPLPTAAKSRLDRSWSESVKSERITGLSVQEIKRQEAIFELYQGELDLIQDLGVVKTTYHDSMKKLHLLSNEELQKIFGFLDSLIPIHQALVDRLVVQRLPDGTTEGVGKQIKEWVPSLCQYIQVCANQVFAKALLDEKKYDAGVDDFLQRCMESPFSRKLDLWGLLDGPRGRFLKYPLLIKSIQRYTNCASEDYQCLKDALKLIEKLIAEADEKIGEAKCTLYKSKLSYVYDDQKVDSVEDSKVFVCSGILKNNKGTKLHVFLLDKVLLVTRPVTNNSQRGFQVYRQPIPVSMLNVEDLKDNEVRLGSFRNAFGQGQTAKNVFRVSFMDPSQGQSHTLIATDEHDKRQWLQCLRQSISNQRPNGS